jgi:hypothetical protein
MARATFPQKVQFDNQESAGTQRRRAGTYEHPLFSITSAQQLCVTRSESQSSAKHPGYAPLPVAKARPLARFVSVSRAYSMQSEQHDHSKTSRAFGGERFASSLHRDGTSAGSALTNSEAPAYNAFPIKKTS